MTDDYPNMIKHGFKLKLEQIYNSNVDVRAFVLNTSEEEKQKVFSAMLKNDMYYLKLRGFNIKMAAISIYNNLQEHKNLDFKDDYSVLLIQLYENYLKGIEADEEKDEVRIYPKNKYSTGYIINEPLAYNVLEHEINEALPQEIETFENIKRGDTESRKQLNGQFLKINDLFNRLYKECLYKVSQTKEEDLNKHRHFFELMNHKINFFNKHGYYWEYCKSETYIKNFYRIEYPELKEDIPEENESYFIKEIIKARKEKFEADYHFSTFNLTVDFSFCKQAKVFHRLKILNQRIVEALEKELTKYNNTDSNIDTPPPPPKTLSGLITHEKSEEIVKAIKTKYKGIKGRELLRLLKALKSTKILNESVTASAFHRCCKDDFEWNIGVYNNLNEVNFKTGFKDPKGNYIESKDEKDLTNKINFLETIIKDK